MIDTCTVWERCLDPHTLDCIENKQLLCLIVTSILTSKGFPYLDLIEAIDKLFALHSIAYSDQHPVLLATSPLQPRHTALLSSDVAPGAREKVRPGEIRRKTDACIIYL